MPGIFNKLALLLFSLTAVASHAQATEVSSEEWSKLNTALRNESWADAVELTLNLIGRLPDAAEDDRARLRYAYLFALSGEMITGNVSHEDFAARVEPLIGQQVILPAFAVADGAMSGPMFNQIARADADDKVMVIATNTDATAVHCFEYATLATPVDLAAHADDLGSLRGRLDRIETRKDAAWAARVHIDDASIAFHSR
jgi:hypothetical protein